METKEEAGNGLDDHFRSELHFICEKPVEYEVVERYFPRSLENIGDMITKHTGVMKSHLVKFYEFRPTK